MFAHLIASLGLVFTMDQGRVINLDEGVWTWGTQPGVEMTVGPFTLSAGLTYGNREGYLDRTLHAGWERERGRWTVSAGIDHYAYRSLPSDLVGGVGVRFRIR